MILRYMLNPKLKMMITIFLIYIGFIIKFISDTDAPITLIPVFIKFYSNPVICTEQNNIWKGVLSQ